MKPSFSALLLGLLLSQGAYAAVMWDESVNGNLSSDRFNPTALSVSHGSNLLRASTGDSIPDFYTIHLDPNEQLSQIVLTAFSAQDLMFIGITTGTTFTVDPDAPDISGLLGWMHYGPSDLGTDLLPTIGMGMFGAQGFTPPLGPGDYSFWMNQFNDPTTYTLDFVVTPVPEPASLMALGLGAAAILRRRRRNR